MIGSDIKFYGSGASNLGGAIGSELTSASLHNLFDLVTEAQAVAGCIEYRCIYVKNTHGTETLNDVKIWLQSNTSSDDTRFEIQLGSSSLGGVEQTISDETTAPSLPGTFSPAASEAEAQEFSALAAGSHAALWVRRVIGVNSVSESSASGVIIVQGTD